MTKSKMVSDAGSSPDAGVMQPTSWQDIPCNNGMPQLFSHAKLARSVDYAALYGRTLVPDPDAGPGITDAGTIATIYVVNLAGEIGQPCRTATSVTSCQAMLDQQRKPDTCMCDLFTLTTAGDQVTRGNGREGLIALLGAIDTQEEAALVVLVDNGQVSCATTSSGRTQTQTRATGDGYDVRTESNGRCGAITRETFHVDRDGMVTVVGSEILDGGVGPCGTGRRPAGLCGAPLQSERAGIGVFLAKVQRLEAASVFAFERLARELRVHGAPASLVAAAGRAALDEIRHTQMVGMLAQRFGGALCAPEVAEIGQRSAFAIALENAVEGCVRETYGALVAHYQASCSRDPEVRAAMQVIAEDETRHASLAWQVARWLEPRLSGEAQLILQAARSAALAQLLRELDSGLTLEERTTIGWPENEIAAQMILRLGTSLAIA